MEYFLCCKTDKDDWFSFQLNDIPDEFYEYEIRENFYRMKFKDLNKIINMSNKTNVAIGYEDIVDLAVSQDY